MLLLSAAVALFTNGEFDALLLGKRYPGLVALTDNKNVGHASSKLTIKRVLNVDNFKSANVALAVSNNANTSHVATTSDHANVANFELDKIGNLAVFNVITNSIVGLDQRIGVTNGTAIVGDDIWNALGSKLDFSDLAKLVLGFLVGDAVDSEATFHVIDETEVLTSLLDRDDIFKRRQR